MHSMGQATEKLAVAFMGDLHSRTVQWLHRLVDEHAPCLRKNTFYALYSGERNILCHFFSGRMFF